MLISPPRSFTHFKYVALDKCVALDTALHPRRQNTYAAAQ
jgi:hypothetical protein